MCLWSKIHTYMPCIKIDKWLQTRQCIEQNGDCGWVIDRWCLCSIAKYIPTTHIELVMETIATITVIVTITIIQTYVLINFNCN